MKNGRTNPTSLSLYSIENKIKHFREEHPEIGLPKDIFEAVSRMTPMTNVDLLIKDNENRVLLAWRDDEYAGTGWHIPGGVIRYKETMIERLNLVSRTEIGYPVSYKKEPMCSKELFIDRDTLCHYISFLFACSLPGDFIPDNKNLKENDPGFLKWHDDCPDDLIELHHMYKKEINEDQWK
jgi:colanic acid biosynthesis protein WcaH